MEGRPSASSVTKSPVLLNSSASASFHCHLSVSSSSSQRRLRALSKPNSDDLPPSQRDRVKSPASLRSFPSSPQESELPVHNCQRISAQVTASSVVQWLLVGYCVVSAAFFLLHQSGLLESMCSRHVQQYFSSFSPINDMSVPYRLSRLLQSRPRPVSFVPFISKGHNSNIAAEITACIWIEAEELKYLESWISNWPGPVSVVVAIRYSPSSKQTGKLVKGVQSLLRTRNKATFHLIQSMPNETRASNAYLNLARLFAQTRYVMLFPGIPRTPLPSNVFRRLTMHVGSSNRSQLASPFVLSSSKSRSHSPVPFAPLSPLLVEQSYPIWCSERFFTAPSRDDDWEECIWQFWLNSYGHLPALPGIGWKFLSPKKKSEIGTSLSAEEIIHRRLSNRFRHESCVLAAKRLKDRSDIPGKVDPRKAQWLRKACRQVMGSWGKDLL